MTSYLSPWDEYRQHPGQIALGKWRGIDDFYHGIVIKNEVLLLEYLKAPIVSKKIRKKLLGSVSESHYRIEATRRLQNYLLSISSLADHTRNLVKDYQGSAFENEYKNKLHEVISLGEFYFLKDMRNYAAHYKIPPIGYIISTTRIFDRREAFLPVIYIGDLFEYDGWSEGSMRYMKDNDAEIELIPLVDVYAQAINGLYLWMFDQFNSLHGEDVYESERVKGRIIESQIK